MCASNLKKPTKPFPASQICSGSSSPGSWNSIPPQMTVRLNFSSARNDPPSVRWHHRTLFNYVFRNTTHFHTADKYPCCHIPWAYICQHLCATMALACSPPPVTVSRGCNGLLTGLDGGNFVASLYSEVPKLPLREEKERQMQESHILTL